MGGSTKEQARLSVLAKLVEQAMNSQVGSWFAREW